jgi:competence protein ComEC
VLDVGQGDAILIESPDGHQVLVDGGPGDAVLRGLGDELPWYDRSLDLVVLTHPQADHMYGLIDVLGRYDVRRVLAGPGKQTGAGFAAWLDATHSEGVGIETAHPGMTLDLGDGARLDVLGPDAAMAADPELNNTGVVMRVSWGSVSFLLTADIEAKAERALLADGADLRASVLKVGHHGSLTSSTPEFLAAVQPQIAAVSTGEGNRFGHPAPDVVRRIEQQYAPVYDTAVSGAIHFETDGTTLWVSTSR